MITRPQISEDLEILVQNAKNGDKESFKEIFERLNGRLFAYVLSHTSSREDSLDIVQETFIDLWTGLEKFQYRSEESFYGFVFKITRRKIFRYYDSKKKKAGLPLEAIENESYEMKISDNRFLIKQLNTLALKYQEILRLRYWNKMTFAEIAGVLEIKETTAKVRHHRAIKKLQILLQKYENTF